MRILVVGAGAVGGYFGGRLLEAGCNVTFLVRPKRAAQLAETGLVIKSRFGDVALRSPPTVQASELRREFDLILLSCKAYDLAAAVDSFTSAVRPDTAILPLLNGMRHLDLLDERFGAARVLGDLVRRGDRVLSPDRSLLRLAYMHLKAYESRRNREKAAAENASS